MNPFLFSVVYLVPFSVWHGFKLGGWYTFLTPVAVFGVVPLIDLIIKDYRKNPSEAEMDAKNSDYRYRILTWICAPLQVLLVGWGVLMVHHSALSELELVGLTISMGISSGVLGINVAHELVHRVNGKFEPFLGVTMLGSTLYMHWGLEHVVGHHRYVATPEDPATAKLGEGYYLFLPRTVIGGIVKVLQFENNRLRRIGKRTFSLSNRFWRYVMLELGILALIYYIFGWKALVFFAAQSLVAISLLEIVNYIEHYGLQRQKVGGTYEPTKPCHSWNSSAALTNLFLFNLQRHSDHHYKPGKRYQLLNHYDESPQLPTGYAGMIWLAAIPPLWKKIMNPKVLALKQQQ